MDAVPAGGQFHRLGDDPAVDLVDQVEALGDRREPVLGPITEPSRAIIRSSSLMSNGPTAGQRDDRLGVQYEAVLVERLLDPSHPKQPLEFAAAAFVLDLAQGDVVEDHDEPLAIACHDRRGGIRDREQLAVLARKHVVVDADARASGANARQRAILHREGRAIRMLVVRRLVHRAALRTLLGSSRAAARRRDSCTSDGPRRRARTSPLPCCR